MLRLLFLSIVKSKYTDGHCLACLSLFDFGGTLPWSLFSSAIFGSVHDSPTFRKMFPEYVEKYNQQLAEQTLSEQVSPVPSQEDSRQLLDTKMQDLKRVETPTDTIKNRSQTFPTWMLLLMVSIFGIVMALPLLQL